MGPIPVAKQDTAIMFKSPALIATDSGCSVMFGRAVKKHFGNCHPNKNTLAVKRC